MVADMELLATFGTFAAGLIGTGLAVVGLVSSKLDAVAKSFDDKINGMKTDVLHQVQLMIDIHTATAAAKKRELYRTGRL